MTNSKSHSRAQTALEDAQAQLMHAKSFSQGRRGAPGAVNGVKKPGRPFTRAAVILLGAALEGYAESVTIEIGEMLNLPSPKMQDLKSAVAHSHGSNVHHIHALLAAVGMPFILDEISWQGFPRGQARAVVRDVAKRRNKIAHGAAPAGARIAETEGWHKVISRLIDEIDKKAADRVEAETGTRPW